MKKFLITFSISLFCCFSTIHAQEEQNSEDENFEETSDESEIKASEEIEKPYDPNEEEPVVSDEIQTLCQGKLISQIKTQGTKRVQEDDIFASMKLQRGDVCKDFQIAKDARSIWKLGYFDDLVFEAETSSNNRITLLIRVKERPAIGAVTYEGFDEVEEDDIKEKVSLPIGDVLSITDVKKQIGKIQKLYAEEGFFLSKIDYQLKPIDNKKNEIEVHFVIDEGPEILIRRIRFTGNQNISDGDLKSVIQSNETGFLPLRLSLSQFGMSQNKFNKDIFRDDVTRLQAYYYDQGYLSVELGSPLISVSPDRQYIDITVPVSEGPRFRIGKIDVKETDLTGAEVEPLPGRKELNDKIEFKTGDWFNRGEVAQNLMNLTRFYRDKGYAKAELNPITNPNLETKIVDMTISIQRGPLVRIERINIEGNGKTRDRVIRREFKIKEGELYSQTLIERSKARAEALGYFETINLAEEQGSRNDLMVLNFQITEKPTGTFQVSAGLSSIESFILTGQIQQDNLFGRGQSLSLQGKFSGIQQLGQIQFFEPYFLNSLWSFSTSANKTIQQYRDFVRDSAGGSLGFGHPIFDDRLRFFTEYEIEHVDISSRIGGFFGAGTSGRGATALSPLPLYNLYQDGLTSAFKFSVRWDSRNNRLFPSSGIFASFTTEVADKYTGSENTFVRNDLIGRFYFPVWESIVFKVNTQLGLISSRRPQGVPVFERYFLGGIFNIRGYGLNDVGPRISIPFETDPTSSISSQGVAIGGNFQGFYNLELEFPIVTAVGIRGVLFSDGGNAWNLEKIWCQSAETSFYDRTTDACRFNPLEIRASWGFGVRWFSPLGPLRFEWGLPINRRFYEDKIRFEFMIGNSF